VLTVRTSRLLISAHSYAALRVLVYLCRDSRLLAEVDAPMSKVNDDLRQLARTLADWAADKSVTVYLFGSRVRGDHRPDSDVDIFVQQGKATRETAVWWTVQNSEDFASLRAQLPGKLKVLEAHAPLVPSVLEGKAIYRDGNVVCVLLPPKFGYGT
jgi:predicted nucleotidyltransferase